MSFWWGSQPIKGSQLPKNQPRDGISTGLVNREIKAIFLNIKIIKNSYWSINREN